MEFAGRTERGKGKGFPVRTEKSTDTVTFGFLSVFVHSARVTDGAYKMDRNGNMALLRLHFLGTANSETRATGFSLIIFPFFISSVVRLRIPVKGPAPSVLDFLVM